MSKHNQDRTKFIGGSDTAACMGIDPWRTPLDVWLEKTGRKPGEEPNERMVRGTLLEPYLVRVAAEVLGEEIESVDTREFSADRPYISSQIDVKFKSGRTGEIKTSENFVAWNNESPPEYVEVQAQQQFICSPDRPMVFVVAAVGAARLEATMAALGALQDKDQAMVFEVVRSIWKDNLLVFEQKPSVDQQKRMIATDDEMWLYHIGNDIAPEPKDNADAVKLWREGSTGTLVADDELIENLAAYNASLHQEVLVEAAKKANWEVLKARMAAAGANKCIHPITKEVLIEGRTDPAKTISYVNRGGFRIQTTKAGKAVFPLKLVPPPAEEWRRP